jgi:hypothetical protein
MRSAFDSIGNWYSASLSAEFRPNSIAAEQRHPYNSLFERLRRILGNSACASTAAEDVADPESTPTNITTAITAEIAVRTRHFCGREESR